ncbi:MAG: hypothetical protein ACXWEW_07475, partial [Nitrososphaeraceae archaeon]
TGPFIDLVGRKKMVYPGMIMQAIGIWLILLSQDIYFGILVGLSILGIGTAFVYLLYSLLLVILLIHNGEQHH